MNSVPSGGGLARRPEDSIAELGSTIHRTLGLLDRRGDHDRSLAALRSAEPSYRLLRDEALALIVARPPAWQVLLFLAVFLDHIEYRRAVMAMAPSNLAGSDILAGWDESMAWIRARVGDVPACAEGLERAVDSLAHLGRMEDEECAARSIVSLGCAASDTWMDLERLAHRVDVAQLPCEFEGVRIGLHIVAMSAADSLARSASETIERVNTLARDWKSTEPLPVCWTVAADWRVLFAELAKLSGGT